MTTKNEMQDALIVSGQSMEYSEIFFLNNHVENEARRSFGFSKKLYMQ